MKKGLINTLLILAFSIFFLSCSSSDKSIDRSTDYKSNDQRYGQDGWREVNENKRLDQENKVLTESSKPEKSENTKLVNNYMADLEKNLALSYKDFNETENKGWKSYFILEDYISAYKLIDAYILKHKETLTKEQLKSLNENSLKIKALMNKNNKK